MIIEKETTEDGQCLTIIKNASGDIVGKIISQNELSINDKSTEKLNIAGRILAEIQYQTALLELQMLGGV